MSTPRCPPMNGPPLPQTRVSRTVLGIFGDYLDGYFRCCSREEARQENAYSQAHPEKSPAFRLLCCRCDRSHLPPMALRVTCTCSIAAAPRTVLDMWVYYGLSALPQRLPEGARTPLTTSRTRSQKRFLTSGMFELGAGSTGVAGIAGFTLEV